MLCTRSFAAALALCVATAHAVDTIDISSPAMSFAPHGKWTQVSNGAGGQATLCADPNATITIILPPNASIVQWYAFKTDNAATYLVCIDCPPEDWTRSFIVDAHAPLATNRTAELWKSQPLNGNMSHTMRIRKAVDPRYNLPPSFLTMDVLTINDDGSPSGNGVSKPALIVGVIAGIACVGLMIALTIFFRRRRIQNRMRQGTSAWIKDQKYHGQYNYTSVRRTPEVPDSPGIVLDVYAPPLLKRDGSMDAQSASLHDRSTSNLPAGAMAPRTPAAIFHTIQPSRDGPPLQSTATGHTLQASASSHISVLSPEAKAEAASRAAHASETPATISPPASVSKFSRATIKYKDPFEMRPPPPPTTDAYTRPWPAEETPPPPTEATFLAAHTQSESPGGRYIPPLPYTLPPTRPSSQSTGQTSVSSIGDLPLPEFLSPKSSEFSSSPPPSAWQSSSSSTRPTRRPGGPRIPPNVRARSSSLGVGSIAAIPEEGATSSFASQREHRVLPEHSSLSLKIRPMSKQLPPTPIASSPLSDLVSPTQKGKAPAKWPDAIAAAGPSIIIPAFKFAPGARPRRRSTGSTPTSPEVLSRLPSVITWEPDFLEFESTPEGTMVTMGSKGSKGSTDTASSPLIQRPLVRIPAVQDSPVDITDDMDGELEDGVLTVSHSPTTPYSARRRSIVSSESATNSSGNRSRRSIPGPQDIAAAVRRALNKETPRRTSREYEQLP